MANTSHVMGLRPIDQPFGNIRANYYEAATGTALFLYHPADLDANGRVVLAAPNSGNFIVGSILGIYDDAFGVLANPYAVANPASVNSAGQLKVLVADDPQQLFVIEEDTGGSALTQQDCNAGANFTYLATTGNTTSGMANVVLDRSTIVATGSNQQFRLIKKWDKPDNAYGNYCKWIVKVYYHRHNPPVTEAALSTIV